MRNRQSRGYRNNNPLNIRKNGTRWQGLREVQTDRAFFQFETMSYGYRAAIKTLRTYQRRYHLYTLREMITRWAPPFENNTEAYIQRVSNRAKILPNAIVDMYDKNVAVRLVEAMALVENGTVANVDEIEQGYDLA